MDDASIAVALHNACNHFFKNNILYAIVWRASYIRLDYQEPPPPKKGMRYHKKQLGLDPTYQGMQQLLEGDGELSVSLNDTGEFSLKVFMEGREGRGKVNTMGDQKKF